jgi:hypothetical protein
MQEKRWGPLYFTKAIKQVRPLSVPLMIMLVPFLPEILSLFRVVGEI